MVNKSGSSLALISTQRLCTRIHGRFVLGCNLKLEVLARARDGDGLGWAV